MFPTQKDNYFPTNFHDTISKVFRRLFRVYAHIYYDHFDVIVQAEAQPHINSCLKHFALFVDEFKLVRDKDIQPLKEVIRQLVETDSLTTLETPKQNGRKQVSRSVDSVSSTPLSAA